MRSRILFAAWLVVLAIVIVPIATRVGDCFDGSRVQKASTVRGPWQRAIAKVDYRAAHWGSYGSAHKARWTHATVTHRLRFERDSDVINALNLELGESVEGEDAAFAAMRDTRYGLRFAPDGHALGVTTDDGRHWTIFDLTMLDSVMEEPFWCAHRGVTSLDPWPESRVLALAILAEADASKAAPVHRPANGAIWPSSQKESRASMNWSRELRGAMLYALFHTDDAELRAAAFEAFLQPGNGDFDSRAGDSGILYTKMTELTRVDPAFIARLRAAYATLAARGTPDDNRSAARMHRVLSEIDKPAPASSTK